MVYYNENTELNEIIKTKNNLINELASQRIDLVNNSQIVLKNSSIINIKNTKILNGKMKLVLPLVLFFAFIVFSICRNFYKKQSAKMALK